MELMEFAKTEMGLAGVSDSVRFNVLRLLFEFESQKHSGYSAIAVLSVFSKVARRECLTPLTGEEDEWNNPGSFPHQNKRCPYVFRDENGAYEVYDNQRLPVVFPYQPKGRQ